MSLSQSYDNFLACLPGAQRQVLDDLFASWRRDFNLQVSSPHTEYVADLMKQERALEQIFCINSFLDQTFAATETQFTGLLAAVDTCLNAAFSREGYLIKLRLEEALPRISTARDRLQLASITAQLTEVQATRLSLEQQNALALRVQDAELNDPPFVVDYRTDRDTYLAGTPIVFELETNVAISAIEVTIPRTDQTNPVFEPVPDTAIDLLGSGRRRITVEIPPNYAARIFKVKFTVVSTRADTTTFFVKFDRQTGLAQPGGRFVRRPCPPVPDAA